jgi:hypothetical protein
MSIHRPDSWQLIKVNGALQPHYRVFGSWSGGYLDGDSWRMNSGIEKVELDGEYFLFHGSSGSIYSCHRHSYGIRSPYNSSVLAQYGGNDNIEILDEMPQDILNFDWKATYA